MPNRFLFPRLCCKNIVLLLKQLIKVLFYDFLLKNIKMNYAVFYSIYYLKKTKVIKFIKLHCLLQHLKKLK